MFGSSGGSSSSILVTLAIIILVVILRNSRPRALKIERLWILPAVYLLGMVSALAAPETRPPITPLSVGILVVACAIGAAIGWQRARFVEIHIHPETHDLSSRASPIGLIFIFAMLALRYGASTYLKANAAFVGLSVVTIGDAFLVLAVTMLATQRLEVWRRASQMLAEANAGGSSPPPDSLVR